MEPVILPARTSHVRDTRLNPATRSPVRSTRTFEASDDPAPSSPPASSLPGLSAPASQESFASARSSGGGGGGEGSGSDMSQVTTYTDFTTPSSSGILSAHGQQRDATHWSDTRRPQRDRTPECSVQRPRADEDGPLFSPMSLASPVTTTTTNGTKRTMTGHIKNAPSLPSTPMTDVFTRHKPRQQSLSSSTGSRAGELAASLKTRLGYAMVKVQHGWERKSLVEVEQLTANKFPSNRYSMSHLDSKMTNGATTSSHIWDENYNHHAIVPDPTASPPSKRRSGTFASFLQSASISSVPSSTPRLQPAAEIQPNSTSRHHAFTTSSAGYQARNYGNGQGNPNAMSPPSTPMDRHTRRPPMIRTQTQTAEAERDALQALFQLGSPHASQMSSRMNTTASQASSSQTSPLRSEFATPRRAALARSESDDSIPMSSGEENGMHEARQPFPSEVTGQR